MVAVVFLVWFGLQIVDSCTVKDGDPEQRRREKEERKKERKKDKLGL